MQNLQCVFSVSKTLFLQALFWVQLELLGGRFVHRASETGYPCAVTQLGAGSAQFHLQTCSTRSWNVTGKMNQVLLLCSPLHGTYSIMHKLEVLCTQRSDWTLWL